MKRFGEVVHYLESSDSAVRSVPVILESPVSSTKDQNTVAAVVNSNGLAIGPRIERCEFEELLQRAMEILNARDLKTKLKTAA